MTDNFNTIPEKYRAKVKTTEQAAAMAWINSEASAWSQFESIGQAALTQWHTDANLATSGYQTAMSLADGDWQYVEANAWQLCGGGNNRATA